MALTALVKASVGAVPHRFDCVSHSTLQLRKGVWRWKELNFDQFRQMGKFMITITGLITNMSTAVPSRKQ